MNDPILQYQGLSAPLLPPRPQEVGGEWMGSCLPPTRRTWAAALTVAACVWSATFAEGAVTPPTGWRPTYPDRVVRKVVLTAQRPASVGRELVTEATAADPGGGFISTGAVPLLQYQALAAPFHELVVSAFTTQISTGGVDTVPARPGLHASRQQAYAADRFAAPTAVVLPDRSWAATYPDRLDRIRQTPLDATSLTPTLAPFLDLHWRPVYPNQHLVRPSVARYVWSHPHFVVEVDVPVLAWTGWYLDPPVRLKARRQPIGTAGTLDPTLLTETTAPPALSWAATYPDRLIPRRRGPFAQSAPLLPLFVPDQTNPVTATAWQGRYADRVPGRTRTAHYPAFHFDRFAAPTPAVVPDQHVPVYPAKVYGKPKASWAPDATWPAFVPDVSQPVTPHSWAATYVDRVWARLALRPAAHPALMIDAQIAPPIIPVDPATGRHRIGIPRRQRTATVRGHQRVVRIPRARRDPHG